MDDDKMFFALGFVFGAGFMFIALLLLLGRGQETLTEHLIEIGCARYDAQTGVLVYGPEKN